MSSFDHRFAGWLEAMESRHLADLTFSEVSRALRALSYIYVERRRGSTIRGAALSGAGKRAAFALFYGPLHYLLVREVVRAIPGATRPASTLVDLGCGTGAAGAAWAMQCDPQPLVVGLDEHPWAVDEATWTYRAGGLIGRARRADITRAPLPKSPTLILAAFVLNELADGPRAALMGRLMERARAGDRLLIVEPVAGFVAPWWNRCRDEVVNAGGREDEWRFRPELPSIVARLDRATGMNHSEVTGRSLWMGA
jgi:hypothetical protein